jgi:L-amino acid N-acyltransferase YncA
VTVRRRREVFARLRHTPLLLVVQKIVRRIPFRPVDVGQLCFLRFDGVPRVPPSMLRGPATVRFATVADLEELVHLQDKRAEFRARFAAGDHCAVAIVEDRIVGYEWFCDKATHRETAWGYTIAIPSGGIYAFDAYIDPAYRNTGVWLRFKAYLGDWMTATGKREVLTFVEYGNAASFRTHVRFGFRPSTTVLALKVLGMTRFADQGPPPVLPAAGPTRELLESTLAGGRVPLSEFTGSRK